MTFDDYTQYDAIGLAALIRRGDVAPVEAVEAAVQSIEARNQTLNAVISSRFEAALAEARAVDRELPLAGVPFLLKDLNTYCAGLPATNGCRAFASFVPEHDSVLVRRFKAAGLVIVGKTNTPELGLNMSTEPALFGATPNPHAPSLSAGGSSGGSAAAVAAGLCPAAHATDSGGSIRIPASNCGLYGLKPSRARVPLGHDQTEGIGGFSHAHAVTRTVRDSALLLDLCAGPVAGDAYQVTLPSTSFLSAVDQPVRDLRLALWTRGYADEPVSPDVRAVAEAVARQCESLGCRVEEQRPPVEGGALREAFDVIFSANVRQAVAGVSSARPGEDPRSLFEPVTLACAAHGARYSASDYVRALAVVHRNTRELGRFFERYDALLTPTLANPPLELGAISMQSEDWPGYLGALLDQITFTPLFNASGCPAASLPLGVSEHGLPVGAHIGAGLGRENLILALSGALERSAPWPRAYPAGQ